MTKSYGEGDAFPDFSMETPEGGTVTTKPFTITGAACPTCDGNYDLFVNTDARGGTASVSLLDASAEGCGSARAGGSSQPAGRPAKSRIRTR